MFVGKLAAKKNLRSRNSGRDIPLKFRKPNTIKRKKRLLHMIIDWML